MRADPGIDEKLLAKSLDHPNVQAYLKFMIDAAVMFGANRTRAQREMTEVLKFEKRFVSVCVH